MEERRRPTRERTYLHGVIYFNNGGESLSCVVRDISYEGARIVIFNAVKVPDEVELHIPERNRLMHATVRWRHGNKIGLSFSEVRHASGKARSADHLHATMPH
jgi:PilZ domain